MALKSWIGKAVAVAQVSSGSVDTYDAATTYKVTIGGIVVSVVGVTSVAATAAALLAALQASTHPYFVAVTWANPSGGTIRGTAATAGVPFTASLTVTGGTGTVTTFSTSTASAGPLHWDTAANWSGGTVPVAADDVVVEDASGDIWFGLDLITAGLGTVEIRQTFTGKLGLNRLTFAEGVNAEDTAAAEYREDYLKITADEIYIGQHTGPDSPAGSQRLKIDNQKAGASILIVYNTAPSSSEANVPAVRYIAAHASADVVIERAPGGVGIGKDYEGETATIGDVDMRSTLSGDAVYIGDGVTLSNYLQAGGDNVISAAATVTSVRATGGTLTTYGAFTITTLTNDGATITASHRGGAGVAITTANNNAGTLDGSVAGEAKTWTTVNQAQEAVLISDPLVLTITTLALPTTSRWRLETSKPE